VFIKICDSLFTYVYFNNIIKSGVNRVALHVRL